MSGRKEREDDCIQRSSDYNNVICFKISDILKAYRLFI